ncbi:tRNA1(Val) (adenine(37)-N6)-methyltransferase [Fibrella aquatilis]|uniref:tRNA1(Val) (adenine(37)-N6)-methyltransferase n=1 Tax=Fibrella aquatilis TaxID=2817059 RepID=A0A939GCE0_9BACT|nr:methyltransferase [Fibrella aquatilis]MBO0934116.1 methyltransferase [Fibrella aquatilis]
MFRFKQFTIQQERAAMKVCTDACVLGAWSGVATGIRLLDIGTGTGLLALMVAQRNADARIDAVELDADAAQQACDNVMNSPFANRVTVAQASIQAFADTMPAQFYDHILTNPPFYTNSLRSPDAAVNRALHSDELPFPDLIRVVHRLLKQDGAWWVLLPPPESDRLVTLAQKVGLQPVRQLYLRHQPQKPVFRHLTEFRFAEAAAPQIAELSIREHDGQTYTPDFRRLLQPYYLVF